MTGACRWARLGLLWTSMAWACLPAQAAPDPKPMNLILILADDLGWTDLGCYGADLHETPRIDRLASQGLRFTQAYTAAPVCSPTRASILTGQHPARLHMTIWLEGAPNPPRNRPMIPPVAIDNLPLQEVTLAELLHEAGYLTALVGKWHLGDAAHYPETQGFDTNIGGTMWGAPSTFFAPYKGRFSKSEEYRYVPHLEGSAPGEYLTDRLTDEALKFIEAAGDRPFFLDLSHHAVHTPIEARPAEVEHYRRLLKPGLNHQNPTYAAMVQSLDQSVGRIVEEIEAKGLADRTAIVLTSDNGGYINRFGDLDVTSNAPLRSGKGSLYEGGVRVPLIVRAPGLTRPGTTCTDPVWSTDLFSTFLQLAGIGTDPRPAAAKDDGRSLVPLLSEPGSSLGREALYWHYPHYYATTSPVSAIREGSWKLLEYHEDKHVELYNLADDLGERDDLASREPERAGRLRDKLHTWLDAADVQMPKPNPSKK